MRSLRIFARFDVALAAALVVGCGNSPANQNDAGASCQVTLTGNTTDQANPTTCATVAASDAGGHTLTIDTATRAVARVAATVDLGDAPSPGQFTSESVQAWDFTAIASASTCTFQAGSDGVPSGSFALTLSSVDTTSGVAHGTLTVVAYVHAPPQTDCGYDDIENITVQF